MIVVIWVIIICSRVKHLWISEARVALVTLSFKLLLLRLEDAERICWIRSKASIDIYVNVDIRFISSHWLRWSIGIEILLLLNIDFLLFKSCLRLTLFFWWATGRFSIIGALNCWLRFIVFRFFAAKLLIFWWFFGDRQLRVLFDKSIIDLNAKFIWMFEFFHIRLQFLNKKWKAGLLSYLKGLLDYIVAILVQEKIIKWVRR